MLYAGGAQQKDGDASTIFEMQMGMVDRGADLTWLSQYPHEREVLLPPLTGIEALETSVNGGMLVINARLSLNMAAHTLEQVLNRRRKMLMDMSEGIALELRDKLDAKLAPKRSVLAADARVAGAAAGLDEPMNERRDAAGAPAGSAAADAGGGGGLGAVAGDEYTETSSSSASVASRISAASRSASRALARAA